MKHLKNTIALIICSWVWGPALALQDEPIAYTGHGALFDQRGHEIDVNAEFVDEAQAFYLNALYQRANANQRVEYDAKRQAIYEGKSWTDAQRRFADAALLDWLQNAVGPAQASTTLSKLKLVSRVAREKNLTAPSAALQAVLAEQQISGGAVLAFSTTTSGQDYINECLAAGVPIPPGWGEPGWNYEGELVSEFILKSLRAEVYSFESVSPRGVCIALPRVDGGGNASALGIICQGNDTSKICYWDAANVPEASVRPLLQFDGGSDLVGGNGICTDCHAGENAFIVHPGTPLDLGSVLQPDNWPDPLVDPSWPQNAGPTSVSGSCDGCHSQGVSGRFPMMSTLTSGYCNTILESAFNGGQSPATMPPSNPGALFQTHFDALKDSCNNTPAARIRVEQTVLDFGDVELGFSFTKALVIHNDGGAPLDVSVENLSLADPDLSQWDEVNTMTQVTLQAGDPPVLLRQIYQPDALGNHSISLRVNSSDPSESQIDVVLTGSGITPTPLDSVLVLDRSGSMNDPVGDRRKIEAMRDAAALYADLLREDVGGTGTGDKLGFVKYNQSNSVYMDLELINPVKRNEIDSKLSDTALANASQLSPDGQTGIGGAMNLAASELGGAIASRKQVFVVLTDGIENVEPWIEDMIGPIQSGNDQLQMYSVGLGSNIEETKLQSITNMGENGYHQVSHVLSGTSLFDLETFYFKIFATAVGMELIVDPTHAVNLLTPDPIVVDTATVITSDHNATFLVLDDPVLRTFYDLEFVSPTGEVIVPGVTIGGIPIQEMQRHTYSVYRIIFPDPSQAASYVGDWVLRLTPNGEWNERLVKNLLAESDIDYSSWLSPFDGVVPIGFAAAVNSDYRLGVQLLPTHYLPGAQVRLSAALTDRGWPAPQGSVDVTVTAPDDTEYQLTLFDDGTHGDPTAGDAIWSNNFIQTGVPGSYKFLFRSLGYNERGELAPREASRFVTLQQPETTPDDDGRLCIPCLWLRFLLLLMLALLLWIWYCTCWRQRG